ncbi:MAG TPA: hypothetical protein VKE23_08875 [Candidatus Limnocylindria bacterium]|nr:hypothetical protein [Candidatus Limnocylindria bacterium]
MTREHIFARWLVSRVHGARLTPSNASSGRVLPSPAPLRISRVVAQVCAECNAGWMSGLEVSFRRTVFARPRVGALHAPERTTLSRWFAKTAVLLAHAHGSELGGTAHRAEILSGMPDDLEVFVARQRRPRQHLDFAVEMSTDREGHAPRARSVVALVDDLVGHVAPHGTLTSRHGTKLWPLRTHALRWENLPVITGLGGGYIRGG